MDRLQRLTKKKLEIDYSKLQYARCLDKEDEKYRAERKRLEAAFNKAASDLLNFYLLYGDGKGDSA